MSLLTERTRYQWPHAINMLLLRSNSPEVSMASFWNNFNLRVGDCRDRQVVDVERCVEERDDGYEACALEEDQGHNECNDWAQECCDWQPCKFFCDALVWVCHGWTWVSHIVCVAW